MILTIPVLKRSQAIVFSKKRKNPFINHQYSNKRFKEDENNQLTKYYFLEIPKLRRSINVYNTKKRKCPFKYNQNTKRLKLL